MPCVTELRGARLSGRIAVSEALANEAIRIALEAARAAGSGRSTGVREWVPAAVEHRTASGCRECWQGGFDRRVFAFENGRIVLEPDILIG